MIRFCKSKINYLFLATKLIAAVSSRRSIFISLYGFIHSVGEHGSKGKGTLERWSGTSWIAGILFKYRLLDNHCGCCYWPLGFVEITLTYSAAHQQPNPHSTKLPYFAISQCIGDIMQPSQPFALFWKYVTVCLPVQIEFNTQYLPASGLPVQMSWKHSTVVGRHTSATAFRSRNPSIWLSCPGIAA